jgi:hypothetical protein
VPIFHNALEHERAGFTKGREEGMRVGAFHMLSRLIVKRFGRLPRWVELHLAGQSIEQLEALGERLLDAQSLEEMLN